MCDVLAYGLGEKRFGDKPFGQTFLGCSILGKRP